MTETNRLAPRRLGAIPPPAILCGLGATTLAIVYAAQYLGGLAPCQLCLYQRWPWWAVVVLSAVSLARGTGLAPGIGSRPRRTITAVCGVLLLAGAGLALYHVGVEQSWWAGLASCAGGDAPVSLSDMQSMMATPVPRCDAPAWTLFGVSMAGYNALLSAAAGAWAIWTATAGRMAANRAAAHNGAARNG